MEILAEHEGKVYGAITIGDPDDFVSPFRSALFPCLRWDHDGSFTDAERSAIAKALLEAGCRYAVCGSTNCEAWHLAFDMEFVEAHLNDPDEVRDSVHVMTTSHNGESPDDVAFFFVLCTNFDDHEFRRYLVLHVGSGPAKVQIDAAVRKYALHEDEV
jgi:hypothetical protein